MDDQRSKMDKLINELRENETLVLNDIDYKESFYIPTSIEKLYIKDCVLSKLFECNLENIRHFEIENVSDIRNSIALKIYKYFFIIWSLKKLRLYMCS